MATLPILLAVFRALGNPVVAIGVAVLCITSLAWLASACRIAKAVMKPGSRVVIRTKKTTTLSVHLDPPSRLG